MVSEDRIPKASFEARYKDRDVTVLAGEGEVTCVRDGERIRGQSLQTAELSVFADESGNGLRWGGIPYYAEPGVVEDWWVAAGLDQTPGSEPAATPGASRVGSPNGGVAASASRRAARAARFVEICSYVFGVLGILLGLIIALTEDSTWRDFTEDPSFSEKYPDFWFGLSVSLAVAFQVAIVVMISAYIQARLQSSDD